VRKRKEVCKERKAKESYEESMNELANWEENATEEK